MTASSLDTLDADLLRKEWTQLQAGLDPELRRALAGLVNRCAPTLVAQFYAVLEADADARDFFTENIVRDRLTGVLMQWLDDLFPADNPPPFDPMAQRQIGVGSVHARIGLPLKLVTRALRVLNEHVVALILSEMPRHTLPAMVATASDTMSIAIDIMNTSYAEESRRAERSSEAFRLFSLGKNLQQEREAQRAAMAEWVQDVMFRFASGEGIVDCPDLRVSEFGLWLTHRGSVIFDGMTELDRVNVLMQMIDREIMRALRAGSNDPALLAQLNIRTSEVKALIAACFNAAARIEGGHDALTGTLNRRFLDMVLAREVGLARKRRKQLSVAILDIDHFKMINDRFGHAAGDAALRHCAAIIAETARAGDFVFRYGGEEFLITLAESGEAQALGFAERLIANIAASPVMLPSGESTILTASVGVAEFAGEPDYSRLISAADAALYRAKETGRNRAIGASSL